MKATGKGFIGLLVMKRHEGSIAGKLSSDGQALSGTYKFTAPPFDDGTWQARKH